MALSYHTFCFITLKMLALESKETKQSPFQSKICKAIQVNTEFTEFSSHCKRKLMLKYGREVRRVLAF